MTIIPEQLDYTDKDHDALRVRMYNLLSGVFPEWTNHDIANFGNALVSLFSFVGDVLLKYQDNQARNSRWSTATQRKLLLSLVKMIGFKPSTATASQVDVTITIPEAVAGDVLYLAGTVVRTSSATDPIEFRLLEDTILEAGQLSIEATAENSEHQEDSFVSPGTPDLEIELSATPYLDGSAVVAAGNGAFEEVENSLSTSSSDRHYTVTVDQNDRAKLRFIGLPPTGTIAVTYKTGGGADGQVEAGTVNRIDGVFQDEFGTFVTPSVTNPEASTPAVDRQSVKQINERAPLSLRTVNRTVSSDDYENNALKIAEVARALMLTSDEDSAIAENTGYLFIIPTGGGLPTAALKDSVLKQCTVTFPNTLTFKLNVSDPLYLAIDVYAVVYLRKGAVAATVDTAIRNALVQYFQPLNDDGTENENVGFGYFFTEESSDTEGKLPISDIRNVIRDTAGVRKLGDGATDVTLNDEHEDVVLQLREFPQLGTVTLINGLTGSPLV